MKGLKILAQAHANADKHRLVVPAERKLCKVRESVIGCSELLDAASFGVRDGTGKMLWWNKGRTGRKGLYVLSLKHNGNS